MSSLEAARQVHALCRRFERLWRAGSRPGMGEFLAEAPAEIREALLAELLALEAELRREAGEHAPLEQAANSQTIPSGGAARGRPGLPRRVAGCDVVGVLGRGGMGVVYKGWQPELSRFVALKVIREAGLAGPEELLRFRREAEAVARLSHPHIVRIHGIGDHEGLPVLCLEFVSGGSLADQLQGLPQPIEPAARLVEALALAMEHAHCRGVVHRDLKPANVLLQRPDGQGAGPVPWHECSPRISDFGLARGLEGDAGLTGSGVVGTPSYMAPEQAAGRSSDSGPAVDVYALGAVLYELLTGRPPFRGEDVGQTLAQVILEEPVPPSRLRPVPADLETICLKCLAKEPARRYARAVNLADDLRAFREGRPIQARPTPWWERLARLAWRNPVAAALIVVAVVSLGVGAGLAAWQASAAEHARGLAVQEQQRAENEARLAQARLARLELDLALRQCGAGDVRQGLRRLARSLRLAEQAGAEELVGPVRVNLASWRTQLARPAGARDHVGRIMATASGKVGIGIGLDRPQLRAMAVCPRTGRLATSGETGLVQLWRCDGSPLHAPLATAGVFGLGWRTVLSLAFSPDGETLAAGNTAGEIHCWHVPTGRRLPGPLRQGKGDLWALAFSPAGKVLASGGSDGRIAFWDAATGKAARGELDTGAKSPVYALAFSPTGATLASGTRNGWVHLWDVRTGAPRTPPLRVPDREVNALAVSPDGGALLVGGARAARFYELPGLRALEPALEHIGRVDGVAFNHDGSVAATAGHDGWVRFWRTSTRQPLGESLRLPSRANEVAFVPGSRLVAVALHQGQARLWEAPQERAVGAPRDHREPTYCFQVGPDGQLLSCSGNRLLLGRGDNPQRLPPSRQGRRRAAARSQDGKWLASSYWHRQDVEAHPVGDATRPLRLPHGQHVAALEFTAGGGRLLTVTANDPTRPFGFSCWELAGRGRRRYFVPGATCFAVSPDGRRVALGGEGKAWVCGLETGKAEGAELPHADAVQAVAWSPAGEMVVTGCRDGTVRVWDVAGGKAGPTFTHRAWVRSVAFSPDGRMVLAGPADGTARFWCPRTGIPLGPPLLHGAAVNQVGFEPGGKAALTCSDSGLVQRWRLPEPPLEGSPDVPEVD